MASQTYAMRKAELVRQFGAGSGGVSLRKNTSNLFRDREKIDFLDRDIRLVRT